MISSVIGSDSPAKLVESFYWGFLRDDTLLQQSVASLGRHLGAEGGYLVVRHGEQRQPVLRYSHGAVDDYQLYHSYDTDFCRIDPLFAPPSMAARAGEVAWNNDLAQDAAPGAAPFFGYLNKLGWRHMLSGSFYNTNDQIGYVRFLRSDAAGPFDEASAAALKQVLPHLTTSYRMREAFSQVYAPLEHVLLNGGEPGVGIAYLNGEGRIVLLNDRARAIFADMDGLFFRTGAITAGAWQETADIEKLIADAVARSQRPDDLPQRNEVSISRPSGRAPYRIQLVPVVAQNRFTEQNAIIAALRIVDGETDDLSSLNGSIQAYQLTAAEARLARYLVAGLPPKEVARQTGLSLHTIRTQQRGLYRKLGVSRYFDLLMKLAPQRGR